MPINEKAFNEAYHKIIIEKDHEITEELLRSGRSIEVANKHLIRCFLENYLENQPVPVTSE